MCVTSASSRGFFTVCQSSTPEVLSLWFYHAWNISPIVLRKFKDHLNKVWFLVETSVFEDKGLDEIGYSKQYQGFTDKEHTFDSIIIYYSFA